jgi:tetratricopeptide (TPR) repeat protein
MARESKHKHPIIAPRWAASSEDQAEDLALQAMSAASASQARALVDKALAIDPECVDALVLKLEFDSKASADERVERLEQAVAIGARRLGGDAFFAENKGHFWLILETRPYMRARIKLADAYTEAHRTLDAIATYDALLDLCPNDNAGVRYPLVGLYLRAGDLHHAALLMDAYEEDHCAVMLYGRFIAAVLGDRSDAEVWSALRAAIDQNPHVAAFLTMQADLPEFEGVYGLGDEREASFCLECLLRAFTSDPRIMMALIEPQAEPPSPKRPARRRR